MIFLDLGINEKSYDKFKALASNKGITIDEYISDYINDKVNKETNLENRGTHIGN